MSVVQIVNRGGSRYLGIGRINSIDEGSPQAEQYQLHYDDCRRALLEEHWWIFATKQQALAMVENDRPEDWRYKYELPAPEVFVEIQWINEPSIAIALERAGRNQDADRETRGRFVYTDVENAYVQFTENASDTTFFPQYFKDTLSAMVAAASCMSLTESVQRLRFAEEESERLKDIAVERDERNRPPVDMPESEYIESRDGVFSPYKDHLYSNYFRGR